MCVSDIRSSFCITILLISFHKLSYEASWAKTMSSLRPFISFSNTKTSTFCHTAANPPRQCLGEALQCKKKFKKKCFCLMYISISVILNFKRLNCGEKRWGKDKASYIFKTFTVYRRERFPVSVKGGINFSWQRHAVVILCEETCCYFDLAITAPKWPLSMLLLSAFR